MLMATCWWPPVAPKSPADRQLPSPDPYPFQTIGPAPPANDLRSRSVETNDLPGDSDRLQVEPTRQDSNSLRQELQGSDTMEPTVLQQLRSTETLSALEISELKKRIQQLIGEHQRRVAQGQLGRSH